MYTDMKQMQPEDLIGNFVYESCLAGIWNIPFNFIYVWADYIDLGISYNDICAFAFSCNFKVMDINDEATIVIPEGRGEFSNLEYLKRKYIVGIPHTVNKQIQQSISEQISKRSTHFFEQIPTTGADNSDSDLCRWTKREGSCNYTASCGEDLVPLMRGYNFCPYCGRKLKIQS